ncbi:N-glycosylation protein [Yarrowia sp. C11]|nr:N-glycosylation protein [Yarrowia sp. E02]KAG5369084.1 N-glycosylation protein [Yarrowia sp. C11]
MFRRKPNTPSPVVSRTSSSTNLASHNSHHPPLKILGLKFVNARLHFLLAVSRGLSVLPPFLGLYRCLLDAWKHRMGDEDSAISSTRSSESIMAGIWCIVAGYLAYAVLDGLMIRWIVTYSTPAAIVRMLSAATLNIVMVHAVHSLISSEQAYQLHIWILISCVLTLAYIIQNFVTSNLALEKKARSVDLIQIAVFAVVPVGMASFLTMLGLIRCLTIVQWDIEAAGI